MSKTPLAATLDRTTAKLPAAFHRQIGVIVTRFALFEYDVQSLVWALAGVDDRIGRLAMREPRLEERFQMVCDLAKLRKIVIADDEARKFKAELTDLKTKRDLIAHAPWVRGPDMQWKIIRTSGNHNPAVLLDHRSKRVHPEGVFVTLEALKKIADRIETANVTFKNLEHKVLDALQALPGQSQFVERWPH